MQLTAINIKTPDDNRPHIITHQTDNRSPIPTDNRSPIPPDNRSPLPPDNRPYTPQTDNRMHSLPPDTSPRPGRDHWQDRSPVRIEHEHMNNVVLQPINNMGTLRNGCTSAFGGNRENMLAKTDVAMANLLVRLDQVAAQCSAAQVHGGGTLMCEEKFQVLEQFQRILKIILF